MPDEFIYLSAETARELALSLPGAILDGRVVIENRATGDSGRWMEYWELVITVPEGKGNFYRATYEQGLTEYQETSPFEEYEKVQFKKVARTEKTITVVKYA
jgi:hypothetical protein